MLPITDGIGTLQLGPGTRVKTLRHFAENELKPKYECWYEISSYPECQNIKILYYLRARFIVAILGLVSGNTTVLLGILIPIAERI